MAVGVGLHDGADLWALVTQAIFQGLNVVFESGDIHLEPGVGRGKLLAVAMIVVEGEVGGGHGRGGKNAEDQAGQQRLLVHCCSCYCR